MLKCKILFPADVADKRRCRNHEYKSASFSAICGRNIFISLFFAISYCSAQPFNLDGVIRIAQESSPEALRIKTSKENKYWLWKTYKSEYKPQLILNSTLPAYRNNNIPVTQEDGSIIYRNINQSQAYANLSLEQNIALTGGKLFLSSDLSRVDDFSQNTINYSGSPVFIGYLQPLFMFNGLKWMNRIEPLKYDESLREYIEGNEIIAYNSTIRYFNLLVAQINFQIASVNKAYADTLYNIGKEKYAMGKLSKDELLQLKYGDITSQKSIANAELSIKTSQLELMSYTGIKGKEDMALEIPESIREFRIDDTLAVTKALENSRRSIEFKRELLEAGREAERARRESGLNANFSLSYGQTNISNEFSDLYDNPQTLQTLNLGLSLPILDWGRARAKRETADANLELVKYTVYQDEINFQQQVITQIENFRMLQDFIEYTGEADLTASERYEIARLRYIAGDISLTEYNIAQEEKDRARQDYIMALRDYWLTYFSVRILTLYDFEQNKSLISN